MQMRDKLNTRASTWRSALLQFFGTLFLSVVSGVLAQYICEWLARFR